MCAEAAKCVYIIELMLLPICTVHSCTRSLDLTCPETDGEISYSAMCSVEVLRRRTERNDIAHRVVLHIDECSPGAISPKHNARSCPCQGRVEGALCSCE